MKVLLFFGVLIGIMAGASVSLFNYLPFHFYQVALSKGVDSEYLKLKKPSPALIKGKLFSANEVSGDNAHFWENMHIGDFVLPVPLNHPYFKILPVIESTYTGRLTSTGLLFKHHKNTNIFEIGSQSNIRFDANFKKNKIFELPYFKNHIFKLSLQTVWTDLFAKNLSLENDEFKVSNKELVYRLYLLKLRERYFQDKSIEEISFYADKNIGVVRLKSEGVKESYELYFYHQSEMIRLRVELWPEYSIYAKISFDMLLRNISLQASRPENAIGIYAAFRKLEYREKTGQKGALYLYSAWGHKSDNKGFLRELIQFLERGKGNEDLLTPFYNFAFKKYKTNFSLKLETVRESAFEKVKRKAQQELTEEIRREKFRDISQIPEAVTTEEERVDYYLQKAKEYSKKAAPALDGKLLKIK